MSTIANLAVQLTLDSSGFQRGISSALSSAQSLADKLSGLGRTMTGGVTTPLIGAGAAALKFATDLNAGMANTQSLGLAQDRVVELKSEIQSMAVETGKSTSDLADGLYQVVSAFGDSADTAEILRINAMAAAAGLATTTDAINLTSAVTKGYGDTSAEAVQHASDLAFETVKLGQTTFPELASSIGRVVPLAASLGVAQEELFAVMATGTGVTGSASEVSTQLRGVLQSLMAPTESMTSLFQSLGYESGAAMLQQLGLQKSIEAIVGAAENTNTPLQSYIGSIEGQTLALALAGPQADSFTQKLSAMQDVAGSSASAFDAQTQGINAAGFTMQRLGVQAEVLMQKVGDGLAPALGIVLERITPLADYAVSLADGFSKLDANTQTLIVAAAGLVAALGPVLMMLPAIGAALGVLASPIGLIVAAVAGLGIAWATNFGGIRDITEQVFDAVQPVLTALVDWAQTAFPQAIQDVAASPGFAQLQAAFQALMTAAQPLLVFLGEQMVAAAGVFGAAFQQLPAVIEPILAQLAANITLIATTLTNVTAAVVAIANGDWAGAWAAMQGVVEGVITYMSATWTNFLSLLGGLGDVFANVIPPDWLAGIINWQWPGFPPVPGIVASLLSWQWPSFPSLPSLLNTLVSWQWPSFPSMPKWLDDLLSWQWPSLPALPSWLGGVPGNAAGTPFWRGGVTWVGEKGPELVELPRGSRIYPADKSLDMATESAAPQSVQVVVNATVANDIDIHQLAYRLAGEIERWRR